GGKRGWRPRVATRLPEVLEAVARVSVRRCLDGRCSLADSWGTLQDRRASTRARGPERLPAAEPGPTRRSRDRTTVANAPRFLPGVTLLSGVILIGFGCALEVETAQVREDVSARPDERTVTYELETTTIEVPLDSGGKPDFLAALERRASEGVTLENNAARDLFRVFGGGEHISPEERAAISTRLGL